MKKLYLAFAILLTFSTAQAEDALAPVEYGTNPYNYNYGQLRGDDPYEAKPLEAPIENKALEAPAQTTQPVQQQPAPAQQTAKPEEVKPVKQEELADLLKVKHKFGLLLPLTGKGSDIGKALRDAAKLAINEKGDPDYTVIAIDVNAPEGVEAATQKALDYGVEAILGPVFSDTVTKVAKLARERKVKVFSFSNNKAVAGNGVYILGMLPDQQVERLLMFSSGKGIKGYSALVPNNAYGKQISALVRKYSTWANGSVRQIGVYSPTTTYLAASKAIADGFKKKNAAPIKTKEVLVIPEGGAKLAEISMALSEAGVGCERVRCLGVSSWDDRNIISINGLDGAWYAASPYEDVEEFLYRFQTAYSYLPDEIATLSYDAVNMAIEMSQTGFKTADVQRRKGFRGIKGIYRFMPDGINQRGYAIYEIQGGIAQVIDGAPNRF